MSTWPSSFIQWSPLLGAAAWLAVAAYLSFQRRFRTWTEVFFIGMCLSIAAYGLCDAVFFNVTSKGDARIAASASLTSLTVAAFFIFLYGVSLHRRFRGVLLLAILPVGFFAGTFDAEMFTDFPQIGGTDSPFVPLYNPTWLYPWIILLLALIGAGIYGVFRTFLEVRRVSPKLARRIGITILGFLIAVVAGSATNTYLAITGNAAPPLFSTSLVVPGLLIFFAVTPRASGRLNAAILRRKASKYDIKGAFLTFSDGTLIGSRLVPEEQMIDADSFSATLDVIQNFMRTSFPTLRGKWLKSIRHGDYTLVMERGQYTFLTLVLGGEENDQLRRQIIETLNGFEQANRDALAKWRGMASDAHGVDDLLSTLLAAS
jgi:hypothetical protein